MFLNIANVFCNENLFAKRKKNFTSVIILSFAVCIFFWQPIYILFVLFLYRYDFKGIIDYIFYGRDSLRPLGVLGPPDPSWFDENRVHGCPHPQIPSDHLPLLAQFELSPLSSSPASASSSSATTTAAAAGSGTVSSSNRGPSATSSLTQSRR